MGREHGQTDGMEGSCVWEWVGWTGLGQGLWGGDSREPRTGAELLSTFHMPPPTEPSLITGICRQWIINLPQVLGPLLCYPVILLCQSCSQMQLPTHVWPHPICPAICLACISPTTGAWCGVERPDWVWQQQQLEEVIMTQAAGM